MEDSLEKKPDLQTLLDKLSSQENEALKTLQDFIKQNCYVRAKVKTLGKTVITLDKLKSDAASLVTVIDGIADSSENISNKVRTLDRARSRVGECQQRVGDLIDLEFCSHGVQTAIINEDYEKGAGHIHRFLSMDQTLLQRTATDIENVSSVLKAVQTLQDATAQLKNIVENKFEEAVKMEDLNNVERFFKIFPLLGMQDEGIRRFCNYLCGKLQETAQKNLSSAIAAVPSSKRYYVVYADTLTLLFEGLARLIDTHQPLIETYYGPGHLLAVVELMQKECDVQTKRILIEFNKHRQTTKKINRIMETTGKVSSGNKVEKLDPKDLDTFIQEIVLMHVRMETYLKFIKRKVLADIEVSTTATSEDRNKAVSRLEKLITSSDLFQCKHELLSRYLQLEQYFMEESISKAVAMDVKDPLQQYTSSLIDDTFFIVRKCIRRAISSKSLDGICAVINIACGALENQFCNVLRNRLRQGYPSGYLDLTQAYNVLQTSIQQGRLQPGDTEQIRAAFTVALNNADTSIEYIETLCDGVLHDVEGAIANEMSSNERGKLESCLSGLSSVTSNLKAIVEYGVEQLRASVIRPRINPWVDSFLTINHQLTEEELSEYEAGEPFVQTLIVNLEGLVVSFKDTLTSSNYDDFVRVLATEVTARLEKVIFKSTFNRLGGLILDKEVRSLASYLTTLTSWSVRDKFARLVQIATILNLERAAEISDYWGNEDAVLTWRLTPTEVKTIMSLRTDFKSEEIRKIKL